MKSIIAARFSMIEGCITEAEDHIAAWQNMGAFSVPYLHIRDDIMPRIFQALGDSSGNSHSATLAKAALRQKLSTQILHIGLAISGYGATLGDNRIMGDAFITASALARATDAALVGIATRRLVMANSVPVTALDMWKISPDVLKTYSDTINAFAVLSTEPEARRNGIRDASMLLQSLQDEIIFLMKTQLDSAVKILANEHPSFANLWKLARRMRKPSHRTRALEVHVVDADTALPLAHSLLTIDSVKLSRAISDKGNAWVQNLAEGEYTAVVSRHDYTKQQVRFFVISGETAEVVVKLKRET